MICFIHIERAGGTTLHHIFRNNYASFVTLTPWYYWANEEANVFSKSEAEHLFKWIPRPPAFGGHTSRSYLGYEDVLKTSIEYITFVRNPVSRYLSQYHYHNHVMKRNWTIEAYLDESRFSNYMTKRIAGCFDVDKAKDELANRFGFVGITERFDESLLLMKKVLGLKIIKPYYEIKNAVPVAQKNEEIDKYSEQIIQNNSLDIELYRFVEDELFASYISNYGASLEGELLELSEINKTYRFPLYMKISRALYRLMYYRNVEYFVKILFHA